MNCPNCRTECFENAKFCHNCGTSLALKSKLSEEFSSTKILTDSGEGLSHAIRRLMPGAYIEKLLATKGMIEGERRVVTILFSDIKGSTSIAENLDPEEVLEIMNGAFEILIEPITRYEGTLARLMGDAILAFFGAPIAHEDDPDRACRAALDILEGAKIFGERLDREKGIKGFNVRVGINTGLVVVAEVGADLRVEYTAMGDAVNLAARMEASADPGTILISEETYKLINNKFVTDDLGPITVKGKTEPINVFRLLSPKKSISFHTQSKGLSSPMIGREADFQLIKTLIDNLYNGTGGIVSIIGEPGLGKSRLVAELHQSSSENIGWIEGRALAYTQGMSYWVARNILINLLNLNPESNATDVMIVLRKYVQTNCKDKFSEIYPFLSRFLNITIEDDFEQYLMSFDAETLQNQMYRAFMDFFKLTALNQPLVLVWEDLHWADQSSLNALDVILPLINEVPILFILIFRMNNGLIWNHHKRYLKTFSSKYEVIQLNPLSRDDSIKLLNNLLNAQNLPEDIHNQIIEKTEGNAFFLEEIARSLSDKGIVTTENGQMSIEKINEKLQIPNMLQSVIMARIDCLSAQNKTVLQTAAVIGRNFQKSVLSHVMEYSNIGSLSDDVLNELQHREFINRQSTVDNGELLPIKSQEFSFKHSLTHDVVYSSLLFSHRRKLHKFVGDAIEKIFSTNLDFLTTTLAFHFEKGGINDKAFHYFLKAAERAKNIYANNEAIISYQKALELSNDFEVEIDDLIHIHEALGDVYFLTAQYPSAIEHYNNAQELTEDKLIQSIIYCKCGQVFERWGRYEKSIEYFNSAFKGLDKNMNSIHAARIYAGLGMVHYRKGKIEDAANLNTKALEIMKKEGDERGIAETSNNLGIIYGKLGDFTLSLDFHQQCLGIWNTMNQTTGLASSYNNIGRVYQLQGNYERAIEHFNKSLELCQKTGNRHGLARTYDNLSQIYINQGEKDKAIMYTEKAMVILAEIGVDGSEMIPDIWLQSGVW